MCYIYILQSKIKGCYYIGSTEEIEGRVKKHNAGSVPFSKKYRSWNLLFQQKVDNILAAKTIESRLKNWKRRDYIEKVIADGYIRAIPTLSK